jgi:hypothetical protein
MFIFVKGFRDAATLVGMSMPCGSIKGEVFSQIRCQASGTRDERQMEAILDYIDQGAADGLMHAIGQSIINLEYTNEATEAGETAFKDLIDIVAAAVVDSGLDFSNCPGDTEDTVKQALNDALKAPLGSSFFQISTAFDDVMKSSIPLLSGVFMPAVNSFSEPEGFKAIAQVVVMSVAIGALKERIDVMSRGYWQVLAGQTLFFAADILRKFSSVAKSFSVGDDKAASACDAFMTRSISLVRAAAMDVGHESDPNWRQATTTTTFWCLQAEECRKGPMDLRKPRTLVGVSHLVRIQRHMANLRYRIDSLRYFFC